MNKKRSLTLALLALSLGLAACGGKPGDTTRRSHSSTPNSGGQVTGELADGVFDYTAADQDTKTDILAHLEGYALRNHLAGIPLYDDASYEQFSQRIALPTTTYITNYGFGTFHGDLDASGKMYTGAIDEPVSEWKSYFHSYTTSDTGTFNYWDSTGADVADRSGMITSSYFDVDMNEAKNDYVWKAGLSMTDAPIMLSRTDNADGTHSFTEVTDSTVVANSTSKYWRVKLHTGAGYTYAVPSTSKHYSTYNGREIALEDYITPYWAMLSGRLSRWSGLSTDASGFEGVLSYVNSGSNSRAPFGVKGETGGSTTNLGIQINYDENALDFTFITPKTQSGAMLNLSSGLYSPIPYDFLKAIGGSKKFGVRGADATVTNNTTRNLDNIIVCGPYIPVYWQTNKSLVYKKNADYYNATDYHFDGVTEDVFTGTNADVTAYNAFLANKLDEVSIPSSQITNHKNDPHVYRTEGSTIIKMNINSCTDEEWDYYFGENGTIKKHAKTARWDVKPIMSNDDFLNGFFYAVDRETLAAQSGRNSALGYLSNAYMIDPNGKVPYRDSEKGKAVIGQYTEAAGNKYAYSPALAGELFSRAINTLLSQGSDVLNDGAKITLTCYYRYQDTIDNIGKYLKNSVETAFNTCQAAKDHKITLNLDLKVAGSNYTDCYNKMDEGIYDFAEGAISGNVLDPLNFMNTICTDSLAQGFCLNWGTITAKVDANDPLEYAGKVWSYDALWSAANSMTIVEKGVASTMGANAAVVDEVPFPSAPDYVVVNGIDEESWAGDSRYVSVVASYPPLTDKEGNSIWHFEYSDSYNAAILCSESTNFQSGYYLQSSAAEWVDYTEEGYGFIRLRILKSAIQDIAQQCSTSLGTDINYFAVQFSFSYTYTNSQGIEMEKITIVEAMGSLSDFSGLTPVTK